MRILHHIPVHLRCALNKHGEVLFHESLVIALQHRRLEPEIKMTVHKVIHLRAGNLVVVMFEVGVEMRLVVLWSLQPIIQSLEVGMALGLQFDSPVVRRRDPHWLWCKAGANVDIALVNAEVMSVLAGAAALHRR